MRGNPKITLIGAGGMSFGPVMVLDAINSPKLRGALMMLHDINTEKLDVVYRLAQRLNEQQDPLSPPDESRCRKMFDELRAVQAEALPF
jgi:alpha-galactosidase/6-phospho-beta-glucosidase family protein